MEITSDKKQTKFISSQSKIKDQYIIFRGNFKSIKVSRL
jgi:hypothetical protein